MNPGRQLDMLIAEKVFRYKVEIKDVLRFADDYDWVQKNVPRMLYDISENGEVLPWTGTLDAGDYGEDDVPPYSTDITEAWKVLEKLWGMSEGGEITVKALYDGMYGVNVEFHGTKRDKALVVADKAPHAICLAALKIFENETNKRL